VLTLNLMYFLVPTQSVGTINESGELTAREHSEFKMSYCFRYCGVLFLYIFVRSNSYALDS
jgi:hypothetical protein